MRKENRIKLCEKRNEKAMNVIGTEKVITWVQTILMIYITVKNEYQIFLELVLLLSFNFFLKVILLLQILYLAEPRLTMERLSISILLCRLIFVFLIFIHTIKTSFLFRLCFLTSF